MHHCGCFSSFFSSFFSIFFFQAICTIVAAFLHYFLLSAFSWMLIEGIFLHILIVKVFHDHLPKKRFYVTFCWGELEGTSLMQWRSSGPVHTNPFSFENAYFCMCFRRSSTLIRWKTDTLTHAENGGFRKRLPRWRLSKTDAFFISVDERKRRKRRFSKTLTL